MVRAFQAFAKERQLRRITGDIEIKSATDYTPKPGDVDYIRKNDVPWLKRFADDGGKVVISGNTAMKNVPHERMALNELGFVVIFFESQWSNWPFFRKCALLLHWWPQVARTIKKAKPGFWHIPCNWKENGKLRQVSTEDPKRLKFEKRAKTRDRKPKAKKPLKSSAPTFFDLELMSTNDDQQSAKAKGKAKGSGIKETG